MEAMMTKYWMGVASTILAVSALSACSDSAADIGDKQLAKSDLAAYAANWDGYVEAYQFEDRSDRVRLVLDEQGHGTVRFGDRDLVAPATDPTGIYPPQTTEDDWRHTGPTLTLSSGFEYTVQNARVEVERVRFSANDLEFYSSYCALQTPHYNSANVDTPTAYTCVPYTAILNDQNDGKCYVLNHAPAADEDVFTIPKTQFACEQVAMCFSQTCTCTATGCTVPAVTNIALDAALDDSQKNLSGTLSIIGQRLNVRLQRQ